VGGKGVREGRGGCSVGFEIKQHFSNTREFSESKKPKKPDNLNFPETLPGEEILYIHHK
jgi:hypothetical protein